MNLLGCNDELFGFSVSDWPLSWRSSWWGWVWLHSASWRRVEPQTPSYVFQQTKPAGSFFLTYAYTASTLRNCILVLQRKLEGLLSQKLLLTILHCCMVAAIVTPVGIAWAGTVAERQPMAGLILSFGAVVLPVLIATRVAWASGYEAGRKHLGPIAEPGDVANEDA